MLNQATFGGSSIEPNKAARPRAARSWCRARPHAEPPNRVVFSWDINLQWQLETDPDKTSEVEVRFVAEGPQRTRVELEHRNLDRHGDGWEGMRDAVGSPDGWAVGLRDFADRMKG
jgi:hypothetical protein